MTEQQQGMFRGVSWRWIPLEAFGFNLALSISSGIVWRLLNPDLIIFIAGVVFALSALISWKLIVRVQEVPANCVSHGILLGIVSNVFYIGWTVMTATEGSGFTLTLWPFVRGIPIVLGCIAGGFLAGRQKYDHPRD